MISVFCTIPNGICISGAGPDASRFTYGQNSIDSTVWAAAKAANPTLAALVADSVLIESGS